VPNLVIEVISPSNTDRDLVDKLDIHRRNGVRHYWIVDPRAGAINQRALLGEAYVARAYGAPITLREGEPLTSPLFPDIATPVARIFRNVRERKRNARPHYARRSPES